MFEKAKSEVLTSKKLFQIIDETAAKIFPRHKVTWEILSYAVAEAERGNGDSEDARSLVLVSPYVAGKRNGKGKNKKQEQSFPSLSLGIEAIEGDKIKARIQCRSLFGATYQQNKILNILLAQLGYHGYHDGLSVQSASIVLELYLPFKPLRVKYGDNGSPLDLDQKSFICPEEVVSVT